jgi:hypothetical protein
MAASPFERPRLNAIAGRFTLERADSGGEDAGDALIEAILRRVQVAEKKYQPPPEITPPEPAPARHAPRAPEIDGEFVQHAADYRSATPPQPERAKGEPVATDGLFDGPYQLPAPTDLIPTRAGNGKIRWIPRG